MAQSVTLAVDGMTCASCVGRAERVLRAQAGVRAASVNLAMQTAHVVFDAPAVPFELAAALSRAGYESRAVPQGLAQMPAQNTTTEWRNAFVALALTFPVFLVEMGGHLLPSLHHVRQGFIGDVQLALAEMVLIGAVLAWPGRAFFTKGFPALLRAAPDMNALVALGAGAAFVTSASITAAGITLGKLGGPIYFEAAGVAVTLILFGRALEVQAKGAAGQAIARLIALQPLTAQRLVDGKSVEVPIAGLAVGDVILVRAGERIAADGRVIAGQSSIDTSMLTGEAMPVLAELGTQVSGGCVNGAGSLQVQITATGRSSVLAQITQMVADAQSSKLPVQNMVDRIAQWFVPAVMAASLVTFAVWAIAGAGPSAAIIHAVAVLIIACPCAMGLAVPMSILVGTGRGAQMGVLFRGGAALQRLANVQIVGFDKTGTLTVGKPRVVDYLGDDNALALAAGIEAQSTHPLGKAIIDFAQSKGVPGREVGAVRTIAGLGAQAQVGGGAVQIGSAAMVGDLHGKWAEFAQNAAQHGRGLIYVAENAQIIAAFAVEDSLKPNSKTALIGLRALGLRLVMMSGDSDAVAQRVGANVGLTEIMAQMLPEDKAKAISAMGPKTAFVGDGINDAPALAAAGVGIAMGTGTDVAIDAGDIVLMSGDLGGVERAIRLSRAVMRNIGQNLFWAFAYNVALIPVAMGMLVPFGGPALSPMLAALAMAASSIFVIGNALRLRRFA